MNEPRTKSVVSQTVAEGSIRSTTFGYITDSHPRLDRFQNAVSAVAAVLAGTCVVVMAVLTCYEVFSRLAFDRPLGWNVSFTERYLMVGTSFFGTVTAYRTGSHVAVTGLVERLTVALRKPLRLITLIVVAVVFGLLFWFGLRAAIVSADLHEVPPVGATELRIPEWMWRSFVPAGSIMALAIVAVDLYREVTAPWSTVATEYDHEDRTVEESR
ncbi:TRAP transporter small permease [Rhodococcus sp. NPDC057297]|uniref:TRAP transporter small permease n=1 Tax=Rhodococcus sp. NPDC057297 TaxID=3346090 RepID=UPI00362526AE